jgi:tripartite-type tricarboxylate transporter receptor subunit TctC
MKLVRMMTFAAMVSVGVVTTGAVFAQAYPSKPVKMVIPYAPGGTSDFVGRTIATKLADYLGQPVVIDNRPGGGEMIGTEAVAKSPADGYTILLITPSFTVNPALQPKVPYDSVKDFAPVALVASYPQVLIASMGLPVNNVKDLIALAKAKPGAINFASGGNGGSNHLAAELFQSIAGVKMTHVPYKGNGPAITDLLGNRVELLITGMAPVEAHVKAGKLKALAVTGRTRLASAPDIPTIGESGLPTYDLVSWYGVLVPAGTPKAVIDRLNSDLRKTMEMPEVKEKFLSSLGADTTVSTPEAFGAMLTTEFATWGKLVRDMNIKID